MSERLGFYLSVLPRIFIGRQRDLFYLNKGSAAALKRKLEGMNILNSSAEDSDCLFRGFYLALGCTLEGDEAARKSYVRNAVLAENIQLCHRSGNNEVKALAEV